MALASVRPNNIYEPFKGFYRTLLTKSAPKVDVAKVNQSFQDTLPLVVNSVVSQPTITAVPEVKHWIRKILDYVLPDGVVRRGIAVPIGYQILEKPENITEEKLHSARVLGWCVEMLQAYLIVLDDILDESTTRRGKPCWHRLPNIGVNAINDALFIQLGMQHLLHKHFGNSPIYSEIMKVFHETALKLSVAEHMETHNSQWHNDKFSLKHFDTVFAYKGSFSCFALSVQLVTLLLKDDNLKCKKELSDICYILGSMYQIKNDYMDVYGDENITGKAGSDIPEGKPTWLAVTAFKRCNEAQRTIFSKNYGEKDPDNVKRIRELYDELQMPLIYEKSEAKMRENLAEKIKELPSEETKSLIHFMATFYENHHLCKM